MSAKFADHRIDHLKFAGHTRPAYTLKLRPAAICGAECVKIDVLENRKSYICQCSSWLRPLASALDRAPRAH
eukprot:2128265-Pleurochrysis_carterae.AAC.3